jgi:tripartite-type tricarboxylate transporter receptor subunit TctC
VPGQVRRLIVPFGRDGATDRVARRLSQSLAERGVALEVQNLAGDGGLAGTALAANAVDALLFGTSTLHCIAPHLYPERAALLRSAFAPVALIGSIPNVLVVSPALGVRSVSELISLARTRPGELAYASAGFGQTIHLCGALFAAQCGLDLRHVAYPLGSPLAHPDLLAGTVSMMFESAVAVLGHLREGRLLALAVTGTARSPLLAGVPTMAESGVQGFEVDIWFGVFAPKLTSVSAVAHLERAFRDALEEQATRRSLQQMGIALAAGTAEALTRAIDRDTPLWRAWLKRCDLLPESTGEGRVARA